MEKQKNRTVEQELVQIIVETTPKIKSREALIKIKTTVQFWYEQQQKKEE